MKSNAKVKLIAGTAAFFTYKILKKINRDTVKGKKVLITGGSRGLGLVLARQLAKHGATVAICARDKDEIEKAMGQMRSFGGKVYGFECDVSDKAAVEVMAREVTTALGGIDVLINNAGIIQVGPADRMRLEEFEEAMNINFWGAVYTTMAVLPQMKARSSGNIVNITSIGGKVAIPHLLPYSVSKFALVGFSEGLYSEVKKDNVYVTTVYPGLMRTGSHYNIDVFGDKKKEFGWFSILGNNPLVSVNAEKAASEIIEAIKDRKSHLIISVPAGILAKLKGIFPAFTLQASALINYALPSSAGERGEKKKGFESHSSYSPSVLTLLGDKAAIRNNELQQKGAESFREQEQDLLT